MHRLLCLFLLCSATAWAAAPVRLAVTGSDSNGVSFSANLVFEGDRVFEFGPELSGAPLATFDLASPAWVEGAGGQRVTLAQARAWAESSRTSASASMARLTDAGQRAFLQEMLSPAFAATETAAGMQLKSRFFSYTASEPLAIGAEMKQRFFAFDELSAYRKAMVQRQAPPFVQLEVTRQLRERGIFPGVLVTEITTPNGSVRVTIRYRMTELTPAELAGISVPSLPSRGSNPLP